MSQCSSHHGMGVGQGVSTVSLKFHLGTLCPTLLCPAGGPPLKRPYGRFRGGPPAGRAGCGCLLPLWTPHAVRLCWPRQPPHGTALVPHPHQSYENMRLTKNSRGDDCVDDKNLTAGDATVRQTMLRNNITD
jgi:hypothetical protein